MAKVTKNIVDKALRDFIFDDIIPKYPAGGREYVRINDRQYGVILTDLNGEKRYVRIGAIVAELRDDMTAEELMQSEIDKYAASQDKKETARLKKEKKAAEDKAKREQETYETEEVSAS